MKSGASDPFGDDDDEEETASDNDPGTNGAGNAGAATTSKPEAGESGDAAGSTGESAQADASEASPSGGSDSMGEPAETDSEADAGGLSREQLPFVLRRDRVKDERPEVHQLFVQQETHEQAVEAERRLEDALDDDLSRTDAREAIYRAGMQHLDDAEAILREWGYDL